MKNIILVDIDGTVTNIGDRIKYLKQKPTDWKAFYNSCFDDEPIQEIIDLVYLLHETVHDIIFCTGRIEDIREITENWIDKSFPDDFNYSLIMRPNSDFRKDTETKIEACKNAGIDFNDIKFVLEDRSCMVKKWRSLGVKCLQVADGDF